MRNMETINKNRKRKIITAFMAAVIVILCCLCGVLGYGLFKVSRINRYSKNINIDSNYFLNEMYKDRTDGDGQIETPSPEEAFSTYSESSRFIEAVDGAEQRYDKQYYVDAYEKFIEELYILTYNGWLLPDEFALINDYLNENGMDLSKAALYANKLLGTDYFDYNIYEKRIDAPYISQTGILPNGCEAVSAVMLLHYCGNNIDPVEFCDKYLEKGEIYVKWGVRYGPNPKTAYAGDPKSEKGGWGCFAPVIVKAINACAGDTLAAKNLTGQSLQKISEEYICNDIPVAIWVTQDMQDIDSIYQWLSYDKTETFLYPVHQHCVVLTGFDSENYYVNDPIKGKDVKIEKEAVEKSYNSMGKQAVAVIKPE